MTTLQEDINRLKKRFIPVMYYRFVVGLTYQEVANKLNISLGTVRSRIHRGKKHLGYDPNY